MLLISLCVQGGLVLIVNLRCMYYTVGTVPVYIVKQFEIVERQKKKTSKQSYPCEELVHLGYDMNTNS